MTDDALRLPAELRQRLLSDFQPTRLLPSPWRRALLVLPVALIAVTAAPLVFEVRGATASNSVGSGCGASRRRSSPSDL